MEDQTKQSTSRLALVRSAKLLALLGVVLVMVPFFGFMFSDLGDDDSISDTAGVVVTLWELKPGEFAQSEWLGRPVWIYRRTPSDLRTLPGIKEQLRDPKSQESEQPAAARNPFRSLRQDYFVFIPLETSRNCQVHYVGADEFGTKGGHWYGGFVEPCHQARFDLAGRAYKNFGIPEQRNLSVPPHRFLSPHKLEIGVRTQ